HVSVTVSAVRVEGKVIALSAVYQDITLRRQAEAARARAEEELRRSEQHLRTVIDTTPECVKLVAPEGTLLEMNAAGLAMLEAASPEDVLGREVFAVIAPEHRERFRDFHVSVCGGLGGALTFDIVGLRGGRRTVESIAVPLRLPEGKVVHLAITRD